MFQARSSLIASRTARETPCEEIRQQLANLRGGSLRKNTLRRHLRTCEGCREFRDQVTAQRNALALILPVAPSLGLKATVLGAAGVTAAAGGGSASIMATAVAALCVAGGGTAAVDIARDDDGSRPAAQEPRSARAVPAAAAPILPEVVTAAERRAKTRRGAGPADHGRPDRERAAKRRRNQRVRETAVVPGATNRPEHAPRGPKDKGARPQPGTGNGSKPPVENANTRAAKPTQRGPSPEQARQRAPQLPKAKAKAERSTPKAEPAKPKAERSTPKAERSTPKAEQPKSARAAGSEADEPGEPPAAEPPKGPKGPKPGKPDDVPKPDAASRDAG